MDNFQKKFLEEASDLINQLEQALLTLEQDMQNPELAAVCLGLITFPLTLTSWRICTILCVRKN